MADPLPDTVQFVLMCVTLGIAAWLGLERVGGVDALWKKVAVWTLVLGAPAVFAWFLRDALALLRELGREGRGRSEPAAGTLRVRPRYFQRGVEADADPGGAVSDVDGQGEPPVSGPPEGREGAGSVARPPEGT